MALTFLETPAAFPAFFPPSSPVLFAIAAFVVPTGRPRPRFAAGAVSPSFPVAFPPRAGVVFVGVFFVGVFFPASSPTSSSPRPSAKKTSGSPPSARASRARPAPRPDAPWSRNSSRSPSSLTIRSSSSRVVVDPSRASRLRARLRAARVDRSPHRDAPIDRRHAARNARATRSRTPTAVRARPRGWCARRRDATRRDATRRERDRSRNQRTFECEFEFDRRFATTKATKATDERDEGRAS